MRRRKNVGKTCDAERGKDRRTGERVRRNEDIVCQNGNKKRIIIVS